MNANDNDSLIATNNSSSNYNKKKQPDQVHVRGFMKADPHDSWKQRKMTSHSAFRDEGGSGCKSRRIAGHMQRRSTSALTTPMAGDAGEHKGFLASSVALYFRVW